MANSSNLQVNVNGRDNLSPVLSQMESKLIRFVGAVSSAMAALKVATFPVSSAADFERELANVKKTTNLTANEISQLGKELEYLSLRVNVSAVDLAKIAAAAGQQGLGSIGVNGMVKFTDSVSRMASVLDITAEDAANDVGKIMNIFRTSIDDVERVVSAFNQSSNNSTASGAQLLNVVRRIGDAAGTINLQESIGLAATGIDIGVSPEVVGTTYSKIFADMRAKADDFAVVMQMSTDKWLAKLNENGGKGGIQAYMDYLARLRQLDSESQAKTISELNGRGRIFAVVNKNVQDSSDAILKKNLADAAAGFRSGTSAIKEQRTVLETLNEQVVILKNSMFALGASGGEQMLGPLTAYVAQLSEALQQPAVKSFMSALAASMLDVLKLIEQTATFLGGLNVNWENLITVIKVMLGLKLIEMMGNWIGRITILGQSYNSLTASIRGANAASAGAGAGAAGAVAQQGTLQNIIRLWRERSAAVAAATAAEAAHARAAALNGKLERDLRSAAGREGVAGTAARTAAANVTAAAAQTRKEAQDGAARVAATEATKNARIEAAQRAHQANISAIQAQFAGRRSAVDQANKAALIAAEDRHLNRQLSGINTYYNRRAGIEQAEANRLVAQAQANEARLTAVYRQAEAQRLIAAGQTARARQLLAASDADVRRTAEQLRRTTEAANQANRAVFSFGTAFAAAGAIMRGALSILSTAFFWFTALYMVLDATGTLQKLPGFFQKITDALGLTSEATRKEAQRQKDLREEMEKTAAKTRDLVNAFNELKDAQTGQVDARKVGDVVAGVKNGGERSQVEGLGVLSNAIGGADAEATKAATTRKKMIADAEAEAARLKAVWLNAQKEFNAGPTTSDWRSKEADIKRLENAFKAAESKAKTMAQTQVEGLQLVAEKANENKRAMAEVNATLFTDKSAELFNTSVVAIRKAKDEVDALDKKRAASAQKENTIADKNSKEYADQRNATMELERQMADANIKVAKLQEAFQNARNAIMADKSLTDTVKDSINLLTAFGQLGSEQLDKFVTSLNEARKNGIQLTGTNVPKTPPATTIGEDEVEPKDSRSKEESEARRLARARLELAKARFAAEQNLQKEHNDQLLTDQQRMYDNGLLSISDYYAKRKALLLANNQSEIDQLRKDIGAVEAERSARAKEKAPQSELTRFDTDLVKLRGQIDVLKAQRKGIGADVENDIMQAMEALETKINATNLELAEALGVDDIDVFFSQNLQDYSERYSDFYAKLVAEGGEAGTALVGKLQAVGNLKATAAVFEKLSKPIDDAYAALDRYIGALDVLYASGQVTSAEYERRAKSQRQIIAASVQKDIEAQEAAIAAVTNAAEKMTPAYQELLDKLAASKLALFGLQSTANQVAADINRDIGAGLQDAMTTLLSGRQKKELNASQENLLRDNESRIEDLRDSVAFLERASSGVLRGYEGGQSDLQAQLATTRAELSQLEEQSRRIRDESKESLLDLIKRSAKEFGISVGESLRDAATKNLTESAMSAISGPNGDGGVGGFFAGLLDGSKLGETARKPMFVHVTNMSGDASAGSGDKRSNEGEDVSSPIDNAVTFMKTKAEDAFSFIGSKLQGFIGSFGDGISDMFGSVADVVASLFQQIMAGQAASSIGDIASAFFHTGGVVGMQRTVGRVSPSVFMGAARYHTGGIAGLQPNEVPAILQRGEEVLTTHDPRHRDNGGAGGTTNNVEVNVNLQGGETSNASSADAVKLGKAVSHAVQIELQKQQRPGGILYGK